MKFKIFSKVIFFGFAFFLGIVCYAQDPNFHIYLCFGQSNMEGNGVIEAQDQTGVDSRFQVMGAVNCTGTKSYTIGQWSTATPPIVRCYTGLGPSDYFGRTMVANLPTNIKVGVVPVAIGGCDIALFDKVNYGAYVATAPSWMVGTINEYGGNPYARLVQVAKLAQKDGVIKGILLHQGETNNGQQDWPNKVKAIYDNLINDLALDPTKTPLLVGELVTTAEGGACGGHNSIIAKVPSVIPNSYVISAAGLPHKGDNLHFTPASYRTLGQRYAQQMLTLLPKNAPVVSLTSPAANTIYTEGDNITITTNATITTGSISNVEFYQGTTLLGSDASSPYTFTWNTVSAGNYALTAKATSSTSTTTTSSAITIQVAKPVYQTGAVPVIDGTVEGLWNNFPSVSVSHVNSGVVSSSTDLSGNWKAMWDATNLYVLVQVTDDIKRNDAGTDVYNDDAVEVYVDMGNTKATTYGTNDQQYTFRWNDATAAYEINGHSVVGITRGMTNTSTGYIMEISIPWSTIGGTASINNLEGFEIMINDDDDGTARDGKMAWIATTDDIWSNPSLMGTILLKGLNCAAPAATITASGATTFCTGGNVTLNASTGTGYGYVWKNGTTTLAGATASSYVATTAGSYSVTVTNSGGCSATSTATTVTVNALPVITAYSQIDGGAWNQTSSSTVCSGSSVVLGPQPTNATGWSWTGPNGYSATSREITLTASQSGNYTATYTDVNSCKASSVFNLTVNALPTAAISTTTATTFCTGGSVVLTASAGSSYKWFNGATQVATTSSYTASTAGAYTVEVTNTSNCKATSSATVVAVNALPTATISTTAATTFCAGGSVVLTAGTGSSYKWFNGTTQVGTSSSYTAATAGSYAVEITNASNCKATSSATVVTVNTLPTAPTVTATQTYCQNATVTQLTATGTGLKWYTQATGGTATTTAPTPTTTAAGTTNYYVSQTMNSCESSRAAIAVTINSLPEAVITPSGPTTFVSGGSVTLNANTGSGLSYKWFNGTTQVGTDALYIATSSGSYAVEVTNESDCRATSVAMNVTENQNQSSVITIVSPSPNSKVDGPITITVTVSDPDGSITLVEYLDGNTVIGSSTSAPYSFTWDNPSIGDHEITVRVSDSNVGVTTSSPVSVTSESTTTGLYSLNVNTLNGVVYPNPAKGVVFIESDVDLSEASLMLVDVMGNEHKLSQTANGLGVQVDVSNVSAGTYVLIIKKDNSIFRKKISTIK